jgi:Transposase DDE domain
VRRRRHGPRRHRLVGRHQAGRQHRSQDQPHPRELEAEVAEILRQAADADQHEDAQYGPARGDELPPALASKPERLARGAKPGPSWRPRPPRGSRPTSSGSPPTPRRRPPPRRNAPHAQASAAGGTQPKAVANTTDPDSRFLHTRKGTVQGYNAQAVTTVHQLVVAAKLTCDANDLHQLDPMLQATAATLAAAGIADRPQAALADSGYWSIANLTEIPDAPELLIPPAKHGRQGKPRKDGKPSASWSDGLRAAMTAKLNSEDGKARYAKRRETIGPVFGQIKEQQGARRFLRRGRRACQAEWKLLCDAHNLLKPWRHTVTPRAARPAIA